MGNAQNVKAILKKQAIQGAETNVE